MPRDSPRTLGVYLDEARSKMLRVGSLTRDIDDNIRFDLDEAYIELGHNRPIISAAWHAPGDEEKTLSRLMDTRDKRARSGFLPPWFRNLLPEGALRALVEKGLPTGHDTDFDIIERLGADLPGAVVILPDENAKVFKETAGLVAASTQEQATTKNGTIRIRFSLAGVQLKMSALKAGESLTIPAQGTAGDVIAKLPSSTIQNLPEVEYTGMMLAQAAGVEIAPCSLLPVSKIYGIPPELLANGSTVLQVERFDRSPSGRIHIEDFAQILGAVDDQKYARANEETVIKLAGMFTEKSLDAILEASRRIAVNILLGNTDAHLKNWSLIYPDGRNAKLSPAYDIVPFFLYDKSNDMALLFRGTRSADRMGLRKFESAADFSKVSPKVVADEVIATVNRAADNWPKLLPNLPVSNAVATTLHDRWKTLVLPAECGRPTW